MNTEKCTSDCKIILLLDEDSDLLGQSKQSSSFYKTRRESCVRILLEHFEEKEGSDIEQNAVMELLNLNSFQKVQATNAVKQAFPGSSVSRKGSKTERVTFYRNIAHKYLFQHP